MPVFNSGPAFFKQLWLPPSVALWASWASQAPRNAAIALKGLAFQLGALSLHPVSGRGGGRGGRPATLFSALAPALCLALATPPHDSAQEEPLLSAPGAPPIAGRGVFLSSADRYIGLGKEDVGALLIVARVRLAPDKLSVPFVTVLGAPAVPWHVDGGIPALKGLWSTVGPNEVSCPPLAFPMAFTSHRFTSHRSTRASDKIPGVSCRIVVLCDKQRQMRIHFRVPCSRH
jgi:hypothetical protein